MMNSSMGDYAKSTSDNLGNDARERRQGPVTRALEAQTAKLPSDLFLWAAGASILASLTFQVIGMRRKANVLGGVFSSLNAQPRAPLATFVGQWVPTLLLLGIYSKIVKVAASERIHR
jgi:hypothetical protein